MNYSIFNHTIESNIELPELQADSHTPPTLFFLSLPIVECPETHIEWCHHWRLKDGQISISVGKEKGNYWLRFPQLADFLLKPKSNQIICYRQSQIPDSTICHLLLDQAIPRLLSHQDNIILHASCIRIGSSAIAFCGESGWGKSTLAAFFYSQGYSLVTDDCLLLENNDNVVSGTPNYTSLRLLADSLTLLPNKKDSAIAVAHYGSKKRVPISNHNAASSVSISAIFILDDPITRSDDQTISTTPISKANGIIEMIKNCFPLDITDKTRTKNQFTNLANLMNSNGPLFFKLAYPRKKESLPMVVEKIITTIEHQRAIHKI